MRDNMVATKAPAEDGAGMMAQTLSESAVARPKQLQEIVAKTNEVSAALLDSLYSVQMAAEEFYPVSKQYMESLRCFKSAAVLEMGIIRREMEDIRKFFLNDQHVTEIARLKEFVELCERLSALKKAGVLDAVADTIIKLA